MTTNHTQSLLLTCLARQIIRVYPGERRQDFYDRWSEKHKHDNSLEIIQGLVSLEFSNFRGWCCLQGLSVSYSVYPQYLAENPPRVLSSRDIYPELPQASVDPWWSDLPWLAPSANCSSGVIYG